MSVDQKTAKALGFHRSRYMAVERERRWLCHAVPHDRVAETVEITDVYIAGTRIRLRAVRLNPSYRPASEPSERVLWVTSARAVLPQYAPCLMGTTVCRR